MTARAQRLKEAIEVMHKCKASFFEHIPLVEMFDRKVVWEGLVSQFQISGHPKAKICYAWSYRNDKDEEQFVTVLAIPPVFSAHDAVRASIVAEMKSGKSGVPPS